MHASTVATAIALLVAATAAVGAAGEKSAYSCEFGEGGAWAFEGKAFAAKPVERFVFEIRAVDQVAQTAELRRGSHVSGLKLVHAVGAHHFIEVAVEGFLNLTTIYELDDAEVRSGGLFPAAHSRHFAVLGEPLVSQYRGFCKAR